MRASGCRASTFGVSQIQAYLWGDPPTSSTNPRWEGLVVYLQLHRSFPKAFSQPGRDAIEGVRGQDEAQTFANCHGGNGSTPTCYRVDSELSCGLC